MKDLVIASTNLGKIKEMKQMLKKFGFGINVIGMNELIEPGTKIEIEETGKTFKENAVIKAKAISNITHKPVLADDSGLEVDALDKLPGIYSARFLGRDTSYNIKNQYIIDAVKGKTRSARYVCALALVIPGQAPLVVEETMEGCIHDKMEGEHGFGYDPIFFFPPCNKTTAMMTTIEKNKYSHRGKALKRLRALLRKII